ncbi:acylphosphatase [Novosphingopyxis sp.]|uniref:acylphosphatase n=1 Tax=Novosphingopyxis sp. TaxID=2709690 RepID=UPI003B5CA8CB
MTGTDENIVARRLTVHGRVQGVFYRNWTLAAARDLGLTGWVRNRDDGTVEVHVEGEAAAIERLVALAHDGPPAADVARIESEEVGAQGFDNFDKRQ